jgi:hypothetical protein
MKGTPIRQTQSSFEPPYSTAKVKFFLENALPQSFAGGTILKSSFFFR